MPIQMKCPSCGKALRIRDESADKKGKCPACGGVFAIPSHSDLPTLEELPRETGQTAAQRKKAPLQKMIDLPSDRRCLANSTIRIALLADRPINSTSPICV